jgi:hypothetical protein
MRKPGTHWSTITFDEAVFPFSPTTAVQDGFHAYDAQLEDFSQATIQKGGRGAAAVRDPIHGVPGRQAECRSAGGSRDGAEQHPRELLEIESIRMWEKDPDQYASAASGAAFTIMSRTFAPADARLRSLIAREKLMPKLVCRGQGESEESAEDLYGSGHRAGSGIVAFFQKDVPLAFKDVKDPGAPERIPAVECGRH